MSGCFFGYTRRVYLAAGALGIVLSLWGFLTWLILSDPKKTTPSSKVEAFSYKPYKERARINAFFDEDATLASPSPKPLPIAFWQGGVHSLLALSDVEWQKIISSLLNNDAEPKEIVKSIAVILPSLPVECQIGAAQHMVNLSADENYSVVEASYFNTAISEAVRRVIFEDFMTRPDSIKLPLLLRTLRQYGHPMRNEALANLQVLTGRNEGDDPIFWDSLVNAVLQEDKKEIHK